MSISTHTKRGHVHFGQFILRIRQNQLTALPDSKEWSNGHVPFLLFFGQLPHRYDSLVYLFRGIRI